MRRLRVSYILKVIMPMMLAGGFMLSCSSRHKFVLEDEIILGAKDVSTKALVSNKQSLINLSYANNTGFGVYGYKSIESRGYTHRQFDNTKVYPTSNSLNTSWDYAPRRYWDSDPEASYQFAAYWPYLSNEAPQDGGPYVSEAGKVLTVNDIPNWQPESTGKDILVADKRGKYREANGQPASAFGDRYVRFDFKHILANIKVKAYYVGLQANQVNVLGMQLSGSNMLTTNGSADYTLPFAGQQNITEGFGNTIVTGNSTHTLLATTSPAVTLPTTTWYNENESNPNEYGYQDICSWIVVPSTGWQGLTLNVTYSLGDINQNPAPTAIQAAPVQVALNTTVDQVEYAGTVLPQYVYTIILKFNSANKGVEIESIKVADWVDVYITPGVYNW